MSESNALRHKASLQHLKDFWIDRPLDSIGAEQLFELVNHFAARPESCRGLPMAIETAVTIVKHIRAFFAWMDDIGRWEAPRKFEKLFRVKRRPMMTPADQKKAAQGTATFTIDELGVLYRSANDQQKLYLLLGLNAGFTQAELASLKLWEIHLDEEPPFIQHARTKSSVQGRWELWPETADLLKVRIKITPPHEAELALLSEEGQPLVHYGKHKTDSVKLTWRRLVTGKAARDAGVRPLSFKHLRKTGGDLIRKLGGLEMAQCYLAHSGRTVAEKYYTNADWGRLAALLRDMRTQLSPVFPAARHQVPLAVATPPTSGT